MNESSSEPLIKHIPNLIPQKTLTICIPTRNRSRLLSKCLELLIPTLTENNEEIALVIVDNNSLDDTAELVSEWIEKNNQFDVTYHRKASNTGPLDSIFQGLESSITPYFMFIGDDDTLIPTGIAKTIKILKANQNLGILVEADQHSSLTEIIIEELPVAVQGRTRFSSESLLYKFGNAWAGIYNVQAMKRVLRDSTIRRGLLESLWGQSELGFIATAREELKVGTLMYNYGYPHSPNPHNPGGLTSILSASHLLSTSRNLASHHPTLVSLPSQLGDKLCSPVPQHLIAILRTWPVTPSAEFKVSFRSFQETIRGTYSWREALWTRLLLTASHFPALVRIANFFLNLRSNSTNQRSDSNKNYHQ